MSRSCENVMTSGFFGGGRGCTTFWQKACL